MQQIGRDIQARRFARGGAEKILKACYDYDVHGAGASVSLGSFLPKNSIVTKVLTDELTAMAGGTTVTFVAASTALTGAIATASFTGVNSHTLASSVDGIKLAAKSEIKLTLAGTYTAGHMNIFIHYIDTDPAD